MSIAGTLLFLFALVGALSDLPVAGRQLREWGQALGIGLPFPKGVEDEVLVIVADFTGDENLEAEARIYRGLLGRTVKSKLDRARIERLEGYAPLTDEDAVGIGEKHGATLVIWGTADAAGMEPRYAVVKNKKQIAARPDLGITLAADLPTYSAYIVEGAPKQFEYLMLFSLGQIAFFSKEYEQAKYLFREALEIELGEHVSGMNLEILYYYRGFSHEYLDESLEAIADFTGSLNLDPNNAETYSARGGVCASIEEYEAALADHNRAIEIDPQQAHFYNNRGNAYDFMNEFEKALADYNRAIELAPKSAFAYANRGSAHSRNEDFEAALADFNRALDLDPQFEYAYLSRGLTYNNMENYPEAIKDLSRAIELGLDSESVHFARGKSYLAADNPSAALKDYDRAIEINPEYVVAYNDRGNVYHSLGSLDAALADLSRAIELQPEYALAYFNRGAVHEDRGNKEAAIADFVRAIELAPADAYYVETARWRIEVLGGIPPK